MNKGFTLIELVLSIFILSIAIIGVFSAFSITVILTSDSADRLTANYLAQEGIEVVRNIRDNSWLKLDFCATNPGDSSCTPNLTWADGLANCGENNPCQIDYTTDTKAPVIYPITAWPAGLNGNYLYLDPINGFYAYNGGTGGTWTKTKFKRKIIITCLTNAGVITDCPADNTSTVNIMKVVVQVFWDAKSNIISHDYKAGENYNSAVSNYCDPHNCVQAEGILYNWYNYGTATPPTTGD